MFVLYGLPFYRLQAPFVSDGARYDFDGVINGAVLKHVVPPMAVGHFLTHTLMRTNGVSNDN